MAKKGKLIKKDDSFRDYLILVLIIGVAAIFMLALVNMTTGYTSKRSCKDSDGGFMPFVKGTIDATTKGRYVQESKTDYCTSIKVGDKSYPAVKEYYCGSDPYKSGGFVYSAYKDQIIPCPNGCSNGACIKGELAKKIL